MSELANDETLIIKQADKGGATVIMDSKLYQEQIEKNATKKTNTIKN